MRRALILGFALAVGAALGASPLTPTSVSAAHHLSEISEIMVGFNGDPYVQYVEINQRSATDQQFTQGTKLSWFGSSGNFQGVLLTVPGNVNPGLDRKWIMGTASFEQVSGMQVDFEFPASHYMSPAGGMICWGGLGLVFESDPNEYVDCVAYGNYSGNTVPSPPPTPLPAGDCESSLTRVIHATGFNDPNPPNGTWADGNNALDFALAAPSPTNDAGQTATLTPTNTDGDLLIDCKDADNDGDGINDPADLCPLHVTVTQNDADADALGDECETSYGTNPALRDSDDDGCADGREARPDTFSKIQGGWRSPTSAWDFYDVPAPATGDGADGRKILTPASVRNRAVTLQDVGVVLAYAGRTSTSPYYSGDHNLDGYADGQQLDRTSVDPDRPWLSGPPNNAISLQDVGIALRQVGTACHTAP